jgi:hypothetical protein
VVVPGTARYQRALPREIGTGEVVSKLGAWNWFSRNRPLLAAMLGGKPFLALILKPPHWY